MKKTQKRWSVEYKKAGDRRWRQLGGYAGRAAARLAKAKAAVKKGVVAARVVDGSR